MKVQIWINSFFFVALLLQVNSSPEGDPKANLTALQAKVEKLLETVMTVIQEYYQQTVKEYKCLPDKYMDQLMNAVRDGIDCVEESHKQFQESHIDLLEHRKEFHKCFTRAKNTVKDVLQNLDPLENKCPTEVVEKTFQINVTTSYTKTFNLNIQNGVEVTYNKTIEVTRNEKPCRNYPDVFSLDEIPNRRHELEIPTGRASGILHHNLGNKNWFKGNGTRKDVETSENLGAMPDDQKPNPSQDGSSLRKEPPRGQSAYAYFEEFKNVEDGKDRPKQPGDSEILREIRNSFFKDRQPEVTAV